GHFIPGYRPPGLALTGQRVCFPRGRRDGGGIVPNGRLVSVQDGRRVTVAGLVLVRQRPGTGNAIFLTLEDETGIANVIVWARRFEHFRPVIMGGRMISVRGPLQCESGVIHIVAEKMDDLSSWLGDLCEGAETIESRSRADGSDDSRPDSRIRSPRTVLAPAAVAELVGEAEDRTSLAQKVMPK